MSDLAYRLEKLKKDREEVNSKIIEMNATAKKEEEILRGIINEIKDLGFNPKTLKEDLANMRKDIESKIEDKEGEIEKIRGTLLDIENNIRSLEG